MSSIKSMVFLLSMNNGIMLFSYIHPNDINHLILIEVTNFLNTCIILLKLLLVLILMLKLVQLYVVLPCPINN